MLLQLRIGVPVLALCMPCVTSEENQLRGLRLACTLEVVHAAYIIPPRRNGIPSPTTITPFRGDLELHRVRSDRPGSFWFASHATL